MKICKKLGLIKFGCFFITKISMFYNCGHIFCIYGDNFCIFWHIFAQVGIRMPKKIRMHGLWQQLKYHLQDFQDVESHSVELVLPNYLLSIEAGNLSTFNHDLTLASLCRLLGELLPNIPILFNFLEKILSTFIFQYCFHPTVAMSLLYFGILSPVGAFWEACE